MNKNLDGLGIFVFYHPLDSLYVAANLGYPMSASWEMKLSWLSL